MTSDLSETVGYGVVLAQAEKQEKEYNWKGAVESYKKALDRASGQDFSKLGEIHERLAYAHYMAGLQSETNLEFRERIDRAVTSYEKAHSFYDKLDRMESESRSLRNTAMVEFLGSLIASEVAEKKQRLDKTWQLLTEAFKIFEKTQEFSECVNTYNQLSTSLVFRFALEPNPEAREKMLREIMECGEKAIRFLSGLTSRRELARAYVSQMAHLEAFGFFFVDLEDRNAYNQKARNYWNKAQEFSDEAAHIELARSVWLGLWDFLGAGKDDSLSAFKKSLEYAERTGDRFVIGSALDMLAYHTAWKVLGSEEPDERSRLIQEFFNYARESERNFSVISATGPLACILGLVPQCEYYVHLSLDETDQAKKRQLLEEAHEVGENQLRRAKDFGYLGVLWNIHHELSKIHAFLAMMDTNPDQKRSLLEEALEHRNECNRLNEQLGPFLYWERGVNENYFADVKFELSRLADPQSRKNLLNEAVQRKELAVKLCTKHAESYQEKGPMLSRLGLWQYQLGDLLTHLHQLTNNVGDLKNAGEAFERAAQSYRELGLASRVAECHWKAAQAYDALDDYLKAAESFVQASKSYNYASGKIPQLKDFYLDYGSYMQAWAEIEKAKHHHRRQEYGLSKECYAKADALHEGTKKWNYLACNYYAWAEVENAEDLSRSEKPEEARQAFEEASKSFEEGKSCLQSEQNRIQNSDEMQMVRKLILAADRRKEYCKARILLEGAKILDRKGDHYSSSEKYGLAVETLDNIRQQVESEQVRREIELLMTLAKAWQTMEQAEAEASPALYLEASKVFEEAKQLCPNESAKMVTLGHSRFCRALEAGNRFSDSGDSTLHAVAVQHLDSAAKYYVKAGFQNASEYAKGTELLFNAYLRVGDAKKESDQEKKTRFYMMAEKLFQASAAAYASAEQPARRDQVLKLLDKVREERELASSLAEVLHAPSILSTTIALTTPTSTQEQAVGLERFAHADIQASLIVGRKTLEVGEDLELEIELVNAGRGSAQLIKLEEMIPQGFEVSRRPELYRVEGSYLNMKGRRLDSLKTEEVKMTLRPKGQGQFTLKPRVLYLDDGGNYRSHEPEPIEITVRELGISGWLKGR